MKEASIRIVPNKELFECRLVDNERPCWHKEANQCVIRHRTDNVEKEVPAIATGEGGERTDTGKQRESRGSPTLGIMHQNC